MASIPIGRWLSALVLVGAGLTIAISSLLSGSYTMGVVLLVLLGIVGFWSWPGRKGPHISHREAQDQAGPNDVIVYWRPG